MYAPAPAPALEVVAPAPVLVAVAPKGADDMTGSVGFGVGVASGTDSLIKPDTTNLMMKYWMNDALALMPKLSLGITKTKGQDAGWDFAPSILADFGLLKGASTRLSAGIGLGLDFAKKRAPAALTSSDTYIAITIPVQIGVEHFFTRWFAMGVGANCNLINFSKQGDPWTLNVSLSNTAYMGSLFFYTD
jgi:hypothetical protein